MSIPCFKNYARVIKPKKKREMRKKPRFKCLPVEDDFTFAMRESTCQLYIYTECSYRERSDIIRIIVLYNNNCVVEQSSRGSLNDFKKMISSEL